MLASLLLRIGALAPLIFYGVIVAGGFMTPGYNHMTQYVSELGQAGAATAKLYNYGLQATGGAMIVGALGLLLGLPRLGRGLVMPGLTAIAIALFGASFILGGLHPMPDPMHGAYHLMYAGIAAPLLAFLAMGDRSELSGARTMAVLGFLASAVLTAIIMNVGGFNLVHKTDAGLWERGLLLGSTLWMLFAFLAIPNALAAKERKRTAGY